MMAVKINYCNIYCYKYFFQYTYLLQFYNTRSTRPLHFPYSNALVGPSMYMLLQPYIAGRLYLCNFSSNLNFLLESTSSFPNKLFFVHFRICCCQWRWMCNILINIFSGDLIGIVVMSSLHHHSHQACDIFCEEVLHLIIKFSDLQITILLSQHRPYTYCVLGFELESITQKIRHSIKK